MTALMFGSIGTLAETSSLQRDSFNEAFKEAGLNWHWSEEDYRAMLGEAGGRKRIADYAQSRGEAVDAAALHARKSALFQQRLDKGVALRPGVAETIEAAREKGWPLALVTTTSRANVDALLDATGLSAAQFDLITDAGQVERSKPAPDAYVLALESLDIDAAQAVAIEDNPDGLHAAQTAGIACYAFNGAMHPAAMFDSAKGVLDHVSLNRIEAG